MSENRFTINIFIIICQVLLNLKGFAWERLFTCSMETPQAVGINQSAR